MIHIFVYYKIMQLKENNMNLTLNSVVIKVFANKFKKNV